MWYEILPSFGIIAGAICASGIGLKIVDWIECEGKPKRYKIDNFSFMMMKRDARITGSMYKQQLPDSDSP